MDPSHKHPENSAQIAIHKMHDRNSADRAATAAATDIMQVASETYMAASRFAATGAGATPDTDTVGASTTTSDSDNDNPVMDGSVDAVLDTATSNNGATTAVANINTANGGAGLVSLAPLGSLARLSKCGPRPPTHFLELAHFAAHSTLGAWVARYLATEVVGLQSPHTLDAKIRDLNGFMAWFQDENGHADIREWLPRDTAAYLGHLTAQGRAPTTINRVFATLRRFARWAHEEPGNIFALGGLPTRGVKGVVVDEADCKRLERRDISRLLRAADVLVHLGQDSDATGQKARANGRPRRNRAMLAMLYYTGLRVSEMVRLTWAQLQGSHLVNVARKGASRSRRIFLPAECRRLLDDYLAQERPQDDPDGTAVPLFVSTAGERKNPSRYLRRQLVNRVLNRIAAQAQAMRPDLGSVAVHPHRLRHSFASEHREKFGRDGETAAALGHTSLQYVARYTRKTDAERDAMIEEMFE